MSGTITTSGMNGGTISTTHISGESVAQWVGRHTDAVSNGVPGNRLTTTWPCPGSKPVVTDRKVDESDADFVERHEIAYTKAMTNFPPVP